MPHVQVSLFLLARGRDDAVVSNCCLWCVQSSYSECEGTRTLVTCSENRWYLMLLTIGLVTSTPPTIPLITLWSLLSLCTQSTWKYMSTGTDINDHVGRIQATPTPTYLITAVVEDLHEHSSAHIRWLRRFLIVLNGDFAPNRHRWCWPIIFLSRTVPDIWWEYEELEVINHQPVNHAYMQYEPNQQQKAAGTTTINKLRERNTRTEV